MIQLIITLTLTTKPILTKSNLSNNVPTNQGRIQGEAHPASPPPPTPAIRVNLGTAAEASFATNHNVYYLSPVVKKPKR
jgi:hypothetical protein